MTTGVLTVEYGYKNLTSDMIDELYTYNGMKGIKTNNYFIPTQGTRLNGICSHCPKVGSYYTENSMWIGVTSTDMFWVGILDTLNLSTLDDFKDWLDTQNVQIVWQLSNPLTYQLTAQQITALIGENNLWSDANGNLEVKYMKKG